MVYLPPGCHSGPHGRVYDVEGLEVLLELIAQRRIDVLKPPVVGYVGAGCPETRSIMLKT